MAFILLLLYTTCIYLRPQEWVPAVYGWPLIDWLAILMIICLFLNPSKVKIKTPQNLLLFGFLITIVLSHLSHFYMWAAYESFLNFGKIVIMFFLFSNVINSEKKIKVSIWFIIILTVVLAIQGIYQYEHGIGWAGQPLVQQGKEYGVGRITWIGIFNDPNDLALAFVMAIGFLLAFVFSKTKFFIKVLSVFLTGILLYSLYFTNSRGGYLALAATMGYFFLRSMKNKFIAVVIGGVLAFSVMFFGPSRLSTISTSEGSAYGRIDAWYQGFQMLKSAPLFGVGYGRWKDYHSLGAHNSYILVAAEEGIVGLFFWMALIYLCFKHLKTIKNKNREITVYILGIEGGFFGFLVSAYFLSRSYISVLYIMLALASAFVYVFLKNDENSFHFKDIKTTSILILGILALVWGSMKFSI